MPGYPFLKGHGTENDFVLLPDHDGSVHGGLTDEEMAARVRALCDRRAGIGGDGVLRVVRRGADEGVRWFMDYRNADGSVSEMCGNGIRVFAQHLFDEGLADPREPLPVDTRDGVKTITVEADGQLTVDMGVPQVLGETKVAVGDHAWPAQHVDMGNPHAVAFVESLDRHGPVGPLLDEPDYDHAVYPAGVNVEFVVRRGDGHVAMRVHERGSGETRSCGTGACAVAVAAAVADGRGPGSTYRVDLPGGTLTIAWTADDRILMTGPAVVVARGTTGL
ncbi:diaminopimelate epimerase [Nocardioides mangrovi]|uniref:Diaminopimelate epimerase n=1 Tax=Nocardioides mangrovi TaxID=2874580 RepID=A0ABS7UA20_9ACTN|nr:diaminopimelate epimerase [Nocardioides mangrovi]MBZ5737715.1 diaminopimelate epimerase [Nocardioides mangrovi]